MLTWNAIIGQSGGPTSAINATLSGVIRGALAAKEINRIYGMRNGIEGLINMQIVALDAILTSDEQLRLLEQTPAAALGSCRKRLPDPRSDKQEDVALYERLFAMLKKMSIRYFFYIGGNDSMDTVAKMSAYAKRIGYEMRVVGIPKTIDNDLCLTDHTPGYGSAAKYVAVAVRELLRDCEVYTSRAVTIVEVMGRDAGWLTAASAVGRIVDGHAPDYVYLPECPFDMESFFSDLERAFETHPNVLVAVSEGLRYADGRYVCEKTQSDSADDFGHKYLAGVSKALEIAVKERFNCKTRSVELNITQRCAAHLLSDTDISESVRIGEAAVEAVLGGVSGEVMVFVRKRTKKYECDIDHKSVSQIANTTKYVPKRFIVDEKNNVTDECCEYILPLISGEYPIVYECGLPRYIYI